MDAVKTLLYAVWTIALFVAGYLIVKNFSKLKETLSKPNALNPASRDNIVYSTVNDVMGAISGSKDFGVGSSIYNLTHVDEFQNTFVDKPPKADMPNYSLYGLSGEYKLNQPDPRVADYYGEGDQFNVVQRNMPVWLRKWTLQ